MSAPKVVGSSLVPPGVGMVLAGKMGPADVKVSEPDEDGAVTVTVSLPVEFKPAQCAVIRFGEDEG